MGLFNKLFSNKKTDKEIMIDKSSIKDHTKKIISSYKRGFVTAEHIKNIDYKISTELHNNFIAIDIETTGLDSCSDRIIEIGAVLFEDGLPVQKFETLVNAGVIVPARAIKVNHITNQMLETAPEEQEAFENLIEFLGDAVKGEMILCAHNATFDINFLKETLMRLGFNAQIHFIDTLSLSRSLIKGLDNYKQDTVAAHFKLINKASHRAGSDAEVCGLIMCNLLQIIEEELEKERIAQEKKNPSEDEKEVCAVLQNMICSRRSDTSLLGFYKDSNGYVKMCFIYTIIKFKFAKKGKYIIVSKDVKGIENYLTEPCTVSEGGSDFVRLFFSSPLELDFLNDYVYKLYKSTRKSALEYIEYDQDYLIEYKNGAAMRNTFSTNNVHEILNKIHNKTYVHQDTVIEELIDRNSIDINPIHNRVPVLKIKNLLNWQKGFDCGFPFWESGEEYRKAGDIKTAIAYYDKARSNGYCAPALFESYAKAYHKIKDYDNEIAILDEGIERESRHGNNVGRLISRRNTAIKSLLKAREKNKV